MTPRTLLFACAGVGLLAGCSSAAVPAQRVSSAEAAVRGAREVGADRDPGAALHLRMAQEQLAQAKKLIADGENRRAEWILLRAESDAELAIALAREVAIRNEAQQALDKVRTMKTETQPTANVQKGS